LCRTLTPFSEINNASNQVGLGQDDGAIDKAADAKVNSDIPGGN
jgi:hypothetical protein